MDGRARVAPTGMAEDQKLYELFTESCLEQLSGIEAAVLDLETAGPGLFRSKVEAVFRAAVAEYARRDRRFGGTGPQEA